MKPNSLSPHTRWDSFRFAFNGINQFCRQEAHACLYLVATILVGLAACYFHVTRSEITVLVLATGFVWFAEMINTAIERIVDMISPGYHPQAGLIKDIAAGAVLVAAFVAFITGLLVFIPKIF